MFSNNVSKCISNDIICRSWTAKISSPRRWFSHQSNCNGGNENQCTHDEGCSIGSTSDSKFLSVTQAVEMGMKVIFSKGECRIIHDKLEITAYLHDNLWIIPALNPQTHYLTATVKSQDPELSQQKKRKQTTLFKIIHQLTEKQGKASKVLNWMEIIGFWIDVQIKLIYLVIYSIV